MGPRIPQSANVDAEQERQNTVALFWDIAQIMPRTEKERMIRRAGGENIRWPVERDEHPIRMRVDPRELAVPYSRLMRSASRQFGADAGSALAGLLRHDAFAGWRHLLPEDSFWILDHLRHETSVRNLHAWAISPDNWCSFDSAIAPYELQSRLGGEFPCTVFDNLPVESSGPADLEVALDGIVEFARSTGIYQLWDRGNLGQDGRIAVLDTGVTKALSGGKSIVARASGGLPLEDQDGHGSAVVSIIQALAPNATIESVKTMPRFTGGNIWLVISALTSLQLHQGIVVMALGVAPAWLESLGPSAYAFREAMTNLLTGLAANGNLAVCAAGNDGRDQLRWPSASDRALAVGAHNISFARSAFSNYSKTAENYILALGGDQSTDRQRTEPLGTYGFGGSRPIVGTSFSTAIVAGVGALLSGYEWFSHMTPASRISLFRNHLRRNGDGFPLLNVADIGAVWPL